MGIVFDLVFILAFILRPPVARCPAGWSLPLGVSRSGEYACGAPLPRDCGEPKGPFERPCPVQERRRGRIYCTGRTIPIVVDATTVGCQMPH